MEDKIIKTVVTNNEMFIILKDGTKIPTPAKVIETFYESGRKDCNIELQKPMELNTVSNI